MDDSKRFRITNEQTDELIGSESNEPDELDEDGFSLEELSQSYVTALANTSGSADALVPAEQLGFAADFDGSEQLEHEPVADTPEQNTPLTPRSILEAMLFVGRPDGGVVTAAEIAGLMRGVKEAEISTLVDELNEIYVATNRATRIVTHGAGYRIQLADDLSFVKELFYGRVREVRLNQASVDCLALISYQPGISREKLEEQLGRPSSAVLNQLVRRQLLEFRREQDGKKLTQRYYPTDRLLQLVGIQSLEDLPQTEDFD